MGQHQNILIAGGTGFIGQAFVKDRLNRGDSITVLGRSQKKNYRDLSVYCDGINVGSITARNGHKCI